MRGVAAEVHVGEEAVVGLFCLFVRLRRKRLKVEIERGRWIFEKRKKEKTNA